MSDPNESATPETRFSELIELCRTLRGPQGCPWDRAQSVRSLGRYLVEESFEVLHAAGSQSDGVATELGDLAFVVALALATAESEGVGTTESILHGAIQKIRRRHPHVFGNPADLTERELSRQWEAHKDFETGRTSPPGHLDEPDPAQPALNQARELQERAAAVGFDWPEITPVLAKLREELDELENALGSPERQLEELGDLLFSAVNLARFLDVDPEATLRSANAKFRRRFNRLVDLVQAEGKEPEDLTLAELDARWDDVKSEESSDHEP